MYIIRDFSGYHKKTPVSVALGNFDGMHLGHQLLLQRTIKLAHELSAVPAVCTFSPHPVKACGKPLSLIYTETQKYKQLESCGIERCFVIDFNDEFASLSPEAFMGKYLAGKMNAKAVVVGSDYCFGRGRSGNTDALKEFCLKNNITCEIVERLTYDGEDISSSRIRNAVADGCLESMINLMGRYMEYTGTVVHGEKLGAKIGYPTANLKVYNELLPPDGVYAGFTVRDGRTYASMVYIGGRPTVSDGSERRFEVNIIGYAPGKSMYGEELSVFLASKIRDGKKFNSLEELKNALASDRSAAIKWFDTNYTTA